MARSLLSLTAVLLLAVATGSTAQPLKRQCGTPDPPAAAAQAIQAELNQTMQNMVGTTNSTLAGQRLASAAGIESSSRAGAAKPATGILVKVYFHVLNQGTSVADGNVPDSTVQAQIQTLNNAYAQTGVAFQLAATTRTTNSVWYYAQQNSQDWVDMTNALHQGTMADLNLYSLNLTFPLLGWSQFPWWYADSPLQDGVFVDKNTLPGGGTQDFNLGMTTAHEVGHWFGLFHPFQGGCSSPGDYVSDTKEQNDPEYYCVTTPRDTCTSLAGSDVFRNILDYPPDACMDTLTAGQATRIAVGFATYRVSGAPAYAPGQAPSSKAGETAVPTKAPTKTPTKTPTKAPTKKPTAKPTKKLTKKPTKKPTRKPTKKPTKKKPTKKPTKRSALQTKKPTRKPTRKPTKKKPTKKKPTNKWPTKKRPTKKRPTKKPTKLLRRASAAPTPRPTYHKPKFFGIIRHT